MADEHKHEDTLLNEEVHEHEHHHHEHDDDCGCGCGHHHHHDEDEHEHHHHHDDDCDCGCGHHHHHDEDEEHEHHHHHHDDDDCDCGCGHHHHHDEDEEHEHHHHHHDDDCDCGCGHHHHHDEDEEHEHHHHHGDDCDCGCGHHHHHDEDGEHEHHHHHHDDDDCDCGCGHHHHHDEDKEHEYHHHHHDDDCDCGCGHHHHHDEDEEHEHHHHEHAAGAHSVKRVYTLQNVGCAHCAAKMEQRISELEGVEDCVLVFETKQLRVTGENPDALLPKIREICSSIESDAKVIAPKPKHYGKDGQRVYTLENLGCAHCAAKMQHQISQLDGIDDCVLVYETKQLRVKGDNPDALLPEIRKICSNIESEVKVIAPEEEKEDKGGSHPLAEMLIGAGLFIAGVLVPVTAVKIILLLAAYLLLGRHVLLTAAKNIGRGQVFDENFLMTVATIGAWAVGSFDEAVGVMLFYRVGEYFEDRAVDRSRKQIMDAIDLRPETVNLVKDNGEIEVIPAEDAQEGDIVLVRPGDRVPLDGEVVEGESRLDTSAVTGEPVPVRVAAGDKATSGCVNTDGAIKLRVTHILAESMVQRILDSVENAAARKPKIDRFITRFSRVYTPAVVAIALLTAIIPSLVTGEWHKWVYTAMTFLVISCPCALVLSVPLTYFSGIGAGSRRGILFKGGASLEALNNVKTIVMDKTGTITKGNFVVQKVVPAQGVPLDENELLWLAAACEGASTHPIAKSIINSYEERKTSAVKAGDFSLVAVGATVENIREQAGEGISAELEGKTILCGNVKLMERNNIDLSGYHGTPGSTEVLLAMDGHFLGHVDIADTIKADAKSAISRMKAQGLTTAMLTGDGQASADAVAQEVGIDEVRARLLPQDKLSALTDIREKCGAVMFVGDGINDAPVLAGADVGAAMGSGADAAIEAADVVFMKADLTSIPISIKIARKANIVSKENIVFALAIKILIMLLGLFGIASMWLAVFADTGVAMLCVLNSIRMLYMKTE